MTTDEKREFARLNAGRRVMIARGRHVGDPERIGALDGSLQWNLPKAEMDERAGYFFWDEPENFDPIDGLGPLKYPTTAKCGAAWGEWNCILDKGHEGVHVSGGGVGHKKVTVIPCLPVAPPVATVSIPRTALERIANFLNTWEPVAGAKTEREREAVELTRILKKVLWPDAARGK